MKIFNRFQRKLQKTQQLEKHTRPKVPERAQQRREHAAIKRRAKRRGGDGVEPQLPVAHAQGKEKPRKREDEAEERVERARQARAIAFAQPQRAQQIIEQGERQSREHCRREQTQLGVDRDLHASGTENAGK